MEHRQIAGAVEPLLVEGQRRLLRLVEVAGGDIGATRPDLVSVAHRRQLQGRPRSRQADPHLVGLEVDDHERRDRLGHAVAAGHHDPVAGLGDRAGLQAIIDALGEPGAAIEHQPHLPEEGRAQCGVLFQGLDQHGVAERHIVEIADRNLAQVADRGLEQAGRGLAVVDVERAALEQRGAQDEGAGGMVPGQPVQHLLVPPGGLADGLQALGAVGGQIVEGDRHHFWQAGGARGQHQRGAIMGLQTGDRGRDRRGRRGGQKLGVGDGRFGQARRIGGDNPRRAQIQRLQRARGHGGVLGEDHGRRHLGDHVRQATVVTAQRGIGGAYRTNSPAGGLGGEAHHRERRGVAREDQHRSRRRLVQQPLGGGIHIPLQPRERGERPRAVGASPGERRLLARRHGPPRKGGRDIGLVGPQRNPRGDQDRAIGSPLDVEIDGQQVGLAERRRSRRGDVGGGHAQRPTTRLTVVVVDPPMLSVCTVFAPST